MRTFAARSRTRTWTGCGRGCGHGQNTVTDWTRKRLWRGCGLVSDWPRSRTGQGHGRLAGKWRGHPASQSRPLRGRKILRWRRSKACPVLKMMRNTLPPLLQQFVTPGLQLRGDRFDACGLFNRPGFNAARLLFVKLGVGRLDHRVDGVVIDVFAIFFQHLDGGADLGGGWILHNQMFRCGCREMACA